MDTLYQRFADLLGSGRQLYAQMVALSQAKRKAILGNQIDELDRAVRDEQNQLVRLQEWERNRKKCADELALKLGLAPEELRINDIIDAAPEYERPRLNARYQELLAVVQEQVAVNDQNRVLIESRLEYVNVMVDTMRGDSQDTTYTAQGGEPERLTRGSNIINLRA